MTATYWMIGRAIVEREQRGVSRAGYGEAVMQHLAEELSARYGRGFSRRNLEQMRGFYLTWSRLQTASALSPGLTKPQMPSALFDAPTFPLPWSHYVRLLAVRNAHARAFYETEALRGGWTIRQLVRQIGTQFYERTALSKNKAAMLSKGTKPKPDDMVTAEEELKDPLVLEFLDLKDEYSESDVEEALIVRLEQFLLHLYLNYAREHWTRPDENPPVGLVLCAEKDEAVARYALDGLPNKNPRRGVPDKAPRGASASRRVGEDTAASRPARSGWLTSQ